MMKHTKPPCLRFPRNKGLDAPSIGASGHDPTEARLSVSAQSARLRTLVDKIARDEDVPGRALLLRSLTHLPRLARADATVSVAAAASAIASIAAVIPHTPAWHSRPFPSTTPLDASHCHFAHVPETQAERILRDFHYIGFHRPDSNYYGLYCEIDQPLPSVLVVSSPFDVESLNELLPASIAPLDVRIISRVFAFDDAPRNGISYTLARAARRERHREYAELLLTYVNPNLGFTGVSYKASGWELLGEDSSFTYRYLDGRYITDRRLSESFATCDDNELSRLLDGRYSPTRMPLAPLLVFARRLK